MTTRVVRRNALQRTLLFAAIALALLNPPPIRAQSAIADWEKTAGPKMSFDVASIKIEPVHVYGRGALIPPSDQMHTNIPLDDSDRFTPGGGRFSATNVYLIRLIGFAYKLSPLESSYSVEKMPKWYLSEKFDIEARGPADATKDQMRLMVRSLLADRFKFTAHWDTHEVSEFSLTLANPGKTGPKLLAETPGSECTPGQSSPLPAALGGDPAPCGNAGMKYLDDGQYQLSARSITLQQIADNFRMFPGINLDRPVVDQSGLTGKFDLVMVWAPDPQPGLQPATDGPSFEEALKDQLGLKLTQTKGPQRFLVIDSIEEPSPN